MKKNVVIIGAGDHGQVVADIIEKMGDNVVGFLDDNEDINSKKLGYEVIGKISDINKFRKDNYFIIAIGNNGVRKEVSNKYNIKYYTAIDPSAIISKYVNIGEGTVICPGVIISTGTEIGKHAIINTGTTIEHFCKINDYAHLSTASIVLGGSIIKSMVYVEAGTLIKREEILEIKEKY